MAKRKMSKGDRLLKAERRRIGRANVLIALDQILQAGDKKKTKSGGVTKRKTKLKRWKGLNRTEKRHRARRQEAAAAKKFAKGQQRLKFKSAKHTHKK